MKYRYSCKILTKLEFSEQIFEKYASIKLHDSRRDSRVVPYGWTDGHDEANSRCSQFCERTQKQYFIKTRFAS